MDILKIMYLISVGPGSKNAIRLIKSLISGPIVSSSNLKSWFDSVGFF